MTLQIAGTNLQLEPLESHELDIHPLLSRRESTGSFAAVGLQSHQVLQLLQAARYAPSSYNSQPWHFIVVQGGPGRQQINQDLIEWGAPWVTTAPVLIAVVSELNLGTEHNGLNYALFDCGLAVQNILLQATSMGLAAHPVGYRNAAAVRKALGLQPEHALIVFVAVGNPHGQPVTTRASRLRKPLSAITSHDRWGGPPIGE